MISSFLLLRKVSYVCKRQVLDQFRNIDDTALFALSHMLKKYHFFFFFCISCIFFKKEEWQVQ